LFSLIPLPFALDMDGSNAMAFNRWPSASKSWQEWCWWVARWRSIWRRSSSAWRWGLSCCVELSDHADSTVFQLSDTWNANDLGKPWGKHSGGSQSGGEEDEEQQEWSCWWANCGWRFWSCRLCPCRPCVHLDKQ
jgi:hypothetical protein